jgi:catechol 2,3-dioxygenase-like lactoylglutathione lyase family enzyme
MEARHPEGVLMAVAFNHTIIAARDTQASASFFTALFVQFAEPNVAEIQMQHYAFLVDDERFDAIYGRIVAAGIDHAGDPRWTTPGQINTNHGGRGVYFRDPAGHGLEVITRPYGATA